MTNDDTSTQESTVSDDPATAPGKHVTSHAAVARRGGDWEQVGRRAVASLLSDALEDLKQETELAVDAVHRGEPVTVDHVHVLRECLDAYEHAVENHLAALADEAEPWSVDGPAWSDGERPRFSRPRSAALDLPPRYPDRNAPSSAGVRDAPGGGGVRAVEPDD